MYRKSFSNLGMESIDSENSAIKKVNERESERKLRRNMSQIIIKRRK
jgi:hypothetical protein